ncbi:MAG TPA: DUF1553 domain-containing protein, partial [Isosphaeraceae bacterium]|nr:DUF1553 domain-containing protein [Isosphaeraceae bacterium]
HPLQCARCHDHKFDPVPTRDYYRIQAVFATAQFADRPARFLPVENPRAGLDERHYLLERIGRYEAILERIQAKEDAAARSWYAERNLKYAPRNAKFRQGVPADQVAPKGYGLSAEDLGLERIARKSLTRHRWELQRYEPVAFSVYSGRYREFKNIDSPVPPPKDPFAEGTIPQSTILSGGDVFSPSQPVSPGVLSCVPLAEARSAQPVIPESLVGRRLAFADWLVSPANPLTPRVMVNRLWQWHFGRGIVATPNNFGTRGEKPSHPELLDWLSAEFLDSGWSIKHMHRLILNSEAYARSSRHPSPKYLEEKDPKGTSLARFHPRRLSAEEIRDAMLAASGELNRALGGVPTRPDMNLEAALQPRMVMGTYAPAYQPSPQPARRHRRTVYAMVTRGQRDPFLTVFDQPSPEEPCEGRSASTVAPQALSLLNGQEPADRALALAARLQRETADRSSSIRRAFLLVTGRAPHPDDLQACLDHWASMTSR